MASNTLEIATPPTNPGKVNGITDLSRPTLNVVLCAATVPCGKAAAKALSVAGVVAHVVSYETDVKATLAKVSANVRRILSEIRGRAHYAAEGLQEASDAIETLAKQTSRSAQAVALGAD